jgi:hypothetical protein
MAIPSGWVQPAADSPAPDPVNGGETCTTFLEAPDVIRFVANNVPDPYAKPTGSNNRPLNPATAVAGAATGFVDASIASTAFDFKAAAKTF